MHAALRCAGKGLAAYQALFDDPRTRLAAVRSDPPVVGSRLEFYHPIWCRGGGSTTSLARLRSGREPVDSRKSHKNLRRYLELSKCLGGIAGGFSAAARKYCGRAGKS